MASFRGLCSEKVCEVGLVWKTSNEMSESSRHAEVVQETETRTSKQQGTGGGPLTLKDIVHVPVARQAWPVV